MLWLSWGLDVKRVAGSPSLVALLSRQRSTRPGQPMFAWPLLFFFIFYHTSRCFPNVIMHVIALGSSSRHLELKLCFRRV